MHCKPSALGGIGLAALAGVFMLTGSQATFAQMYSRPATTATPSSPMMEHTMKPESATARPLSRVKDPSTTLASATVNDSSGQSVGQVQSVKTSASGKAQSVAVSLSSSTTPGKIVTLQADQLTYDPTNNQLKASLTMDQINQLPAIQTP